MHKFRTAAALVLATVSGQSLADVTFYDNSDLAFHFSPFEPRAAFGPGVSMPLLVQTTLYPLSSPADNADNIGVGFHTFSYKINRNPSSSSTVEEDILTGSPSASVRFGLTGNWLTNSGELKRVSLDSGFPTETIPTPEPASSVATFDGRTYVGTTLGGVFSSDDNLEWGLTRYMTASIKTLSPRPEGLIIVDSAGQASVFDWLSGPDTGYYVSPDTVDAAYTGNFNLFTQAPGAVDVFAADTLLLVDTWTLPVEASAIFVRPGNVCKADTNRNGVLEAGDFSAWVAAYNRGDFIADQNNDLAVTPADFSAWVSAFNLGCD